ncbi:hypothetical protein QR680_004445 [Steinernema hermaphroditum]|uniref:Uncharacterized protein n=1 Tax=Steinernema hermaphroditum TaxID=289476 RepID=A0AA39HR06_9BILA|nr:hypothetical protein QR680_004445 [Steinernema hermaphroditum]
MSGTIPGVPARRRRSSKSSGKVKDERTSVKKPQMAQKEEMEIEFDVVEEVEGGNASEEEEICQVLMMSATRRQKWRSKVEYFMVTLSYLVGLDHIMSFISILSMYGTAMFVPYFLSLIIFGIPVLYLEMALGQYSSLDSYLLFERLAPAMAGTGYASTILSLLGIISNEAMATVALESVFTSTNDVLLRSRVFFDGCNNEYNTDDCMDPIVMNYCREIGLSYYGGACLEKETIDPVSYNYTNALYQQAHLNREKSPMYQYLTIKLLGFLNHTSVRQPSVHVFFFSVLCFAILVYFVMKGIRAMVKLSYVTLLFPLGVMFMVAIAVFASLEGPQMAVHDILAFDASKLLEVRLWTATVSHMFVALKLGQGGVITLGTYNNFHNDILLDMVIIVLATFFIPMFFTFTLVLAFGAFAKFVMEDGDRHHLTTMFSYFIEPDIFVVANNGLRLIPTFGVAFLTLVAISFFLLALGNMITRLKLVTNALSEKIEILRQPQNIAVTAGIIVLVLASFSFVYFSSYGTVVYSVIYVYTVPTAAMVVVLCETITVVVCYGGKQILANTHVMLFGEKESRLMDEEQQGFKGKVLPYVNVYLISMLRSLVIIVLTLALGVITVGLYTFAEAKSHQYPKFSIAFPFGVCSLLAVVVVIPIILCYKIIWTKIQKRPVMRLFKPHLKLWGPQEKAKRNLVDRFEKRLGVVH